jgi:hypothetical protein
LLILTANVKKHYIFKNVAKSKNIFLPISIIYGFFPIVVPKKYKIEDPIVHLPETVLPIPTKIYKYCISNFIVIKLKATENYYQIFFNKFPEYF